MSSTFIPPLPSARHIPQTTKCTARPPNDPTNLRTESQRRRNSPPKPLRRRRRRNDTPQPLDWDAMTSVPLVRPDATPESGEDYWWDFDKVKLGDPDLGTAPRKARKEIDERLKTKLKKEVVRPYTENWILRFGIVVLVLVVAVWLFGGVDSIPIIAVPDL